MTTLTISVIIPAHNSAATLGEALDSVVAQTAPVREIIVVDDNSSDPTAAVFEEWAAGHPEMPAALIRQPSNTGPAGARNRGMFAATGSWIAFLDADDAWLPHRLEVQARVLAARPNAALLCGQTIPLAPGSRLPPPEPTFRLKPLKLDDFIIHNPVATSTVIASREALDQAGLFDTQFRGPEDYDLWLRLAALHDCLYMDTPLSRYRTTPGSLSMDERTFLPQVLGVLRKAFAPGGALHGHRHHRRLAYAEQYASASWMAYHRGARLAAVRHLLRSWLSSPASIHKEREQDRLLRLKLLGLYLFGKSQPPPPDRQPPAA